MRQQHAQRSRRFRGAGHATISRPYTRCGVRSFDEVHAVPDERFSPNSGNQDVPARIGFSSQSASAERRAMGTPSGVTRQQRSRVQTHAHVGRQQRPLRNLRPAGRCFGYFADALVCSFHQRPLCGITSEDVTRVRQQCSLTRKQSASPLIGEALLRAM